MKTVIYPMGKLGLRNGAYCGSQCRHGCTKQQFDDAKAAAEELATALGSQWTPTVWENMGWHGKATLGTMRVDKFGRGRAATYGFNTGTGPQFLGEGKTPEAAVQDGLGKMRKHLRDVGEAYKKLVATAWPGSSSEGIVK